MRMLNFQLQERRCQIAAKAIIFAYNLPGVNNLTLTRDDLVGIYNGTYRFWNDSVFAVHNPRVVFPSAPIIPVARYDSSGTTSTFTKALSAFSDAWNNTYGSFSDRSRWNPSVVKTFGQRTSGLADLLTNIPFSIGYLTLYSANEVNLPHASVVNRFSRVVDGTTAAVQAAVDAVTTQMDVELHADLVDVASPDAYPIVGFSYFLIRMTYTGECRRTTELASYIMWLTETSQAYNEAQNLLMVSMHGTIATMIREQIIGRMTCSGEKVIDLLAKQTYNEEESRKTWKTPVIVVTPFIIVVILCLIAYALRQKFKYLRMLDRNDWSINFFDIDFLAPKSCRQVMLQNGPDIQIEVSQTGTSSLQTWEVSGYPGKLDGQCVNVRPTRIPIAKAAMNRKFRQTLMHMRETLSHVNISRFYGLTKSQNGEMFLVEELCERARLDEFLRQQKYKMEENTLFAIAADIANGMDFLHRRGIIHGCLKTACCFVDSRWTVKITDWEYNSIYTVLRKVRQNRNCIDFQKSFLFQLSRQISSAKEEDVTYHEFWTPPEVLKYAYLSEPTKAGDVYAVGLVIYEIFTAHIVVTDIKHQVVHGTKRMDGLEKLSRKEMLPPKVLHIIESACNKDFARRPTVNHLLMMIRSANPSVKLSVLDSIMKTIETYIKQLEEKTISNSTEARETRKSYDQMYLQLVPEVESSKVIGGLARQYEVALLGVRIQVQLISSTSRVTDVLAFLDYFLNLVDSLVNQTHWISRVETVSNSAVLAVGLSKPFTPSDVSDLAAKALKMERCVTVKWSEKFKAAAVSAAAFGNSSVLSAAIHCGTVFAGLGKNGGVPKHIIYGEPLDTCREMSHVTASNKKVLVSGCAAKMLMDCEKFSISPVKIVDQNRFNVELFWLEELLDSKEMGGMAPVETD